jgi:hypothetical protein
MYVMSCFHGLGRERMAAHGLGRARKIYDDQLDDDPNVLPRPRKCYILHCNHVRGPVGHGPSREL